MKTIKTVLILIVFVFTSGYMKSQNIFKAIVLDKEEKEPIVGATVLLQGTTNGTNTDSKGFAIINNIPDGKQVIEIRFVGYETKIDTFLFPLKDTLPMQVYLKTAGEEELEEVVISTTRSSRTIDDIPTRVETISGGELEEHAVMQPGNIKMMLTESTGIQTQQTSQVSASAGIRIQGLDGKYTQLLQDGFPLYSGFSSGLSILQIPPLNLKRVEVIKGSASTLYGGGAIAGLINLITKEPTEKRELSVLVNANQTKALDISTFYAQKFKKVGITLYAANNDQKAYDNNKDGFSDIPQFVRYTINPKFFYYLNNTTTISLGLNGIIEKRIGGDVKFINQGADTAHTFFERNNSNRYSSQLKFEKIFSNKNILTVKNSVGYFNRTIQRPTFSFNGLQWSSYSELNYLIPKEKSEWNLGANYITDDFRQLNKDTNKLSYYNAIFGVFAQNNLKLSDKFLIESGLRLDITNRANFLVLPRISAMYKITSKLTTRIGGGMGYKPPTVFSEDAEARAFQNIVPLDYSKVKPDKSYGANADVNYKTVLFENLFLSFNQLFFYTIVQNPLILTPITNTGSYEFLNANGKIETKGFETNVKLRYKDFSCYVGYTYIDAKRNFNHVSTINPLTAKQRINANVMYEWREKLRLAFEVFYVDPQYLSSGEKVRSYWVMGVSAERKFKHFSLFVNLENFLDTRQSRWEAMYSGTIQNPQFREVYTPTDGFIFNGGFRLNL